MSREHFYDLVIYQIYPRSFMDTNGDGIGDLKGVISKLDYIKDLGANAIWLCPCYKSPNKDNGYDVADYRDIMDEFGTMDDIKTLISEMHSRDMKLIMDLVPNHTSDKHEWFAASKQSKDNPYSDYYYWFDKPLNDWRASFGGSAWEYVKERNQYYLHSYAIQQPDLNWENPAVVKEMQDVVDFWSDLGVDGFRIDVIDQISKDFENGRNCFGPNLHKYINALFGREKVSHLFTVGECWANDIEEIKRHIGEDRNELTTLFQFNHLETGRSEKFTPMEDSLTSARDILIKWQLLTQQNNLIYSLFTDNHDNPPFISRAGDTTDYHYESATCIATMFYLLRGVPFIFQGQEFGRISSCYPDISYFDDIESKDMYLRLLDSGLTSEQAIERINFGGRDNARRPMAWNGDKGFGFTDGTPWIPFATDGERINLEKDVNAEKSIFAFYKALLKLRKENEAFRKGEFSVLSNEADEFFKFRRKYGNDSFVIICNFESSSEIDGDYGTLVLTNYPDRTSSSHSFRPFEIAVYKER